jgi:hypothetical protein
MQNGSLLPFIKDTNKQEYHYSDHHERLRKRLPPLQYNSTYNQDFIKMPRI